MDATVKPARMGWIDHLRVLSCFAVVLIHVTGETYFRFATAPAWEWWLANIMNGSARAAVPLFVMISGALMKEGDCDPMTFYRRKAIRLLPVIIVWSALYAAFDVAVLGLSAKEIALLFVSKGFVYLHLWYLSMYAFMLAFAPYLARFKFRFSSNRRDQGIFLAVCIGVVSLDWLFDFLCRIHQLPFIFWTRTFVEFIPYFLLGMLLSDLKSNPRRSRSAVYLLMALIAGWIANYLACRFLGLADDTMPLANRSPFVIAIAVAVFLFIRDRAAGVKNPIWLTRAADASFGIYLLHPFFLWLFRRLLRGTDINIVSGWWMPLTALVIFVVSFICIFILRQFSLGRKIS